jgi:hypothetical protein
MSQLLLFFSPSPFSSSEGRIENLAQAQWIAEAAIGAYAANRVEMPDRQYWRRLAATWYVSLSAISPEPWRELREIATIS